MLAPRAPGRAGDGFAPAKELAEVSLAQAGAAFSGSAKAAAIAVGTLDTPAKEFVRPFPKQVGGHLLRSNQEPQSAAIAVGTPDTPAKEIAQPHPKQESGQNEGRNNAEVQLHFHRHAGHAGRRLGAAAIQRNADA